MGLTELLLGKENPVSKYVGQNRNTIRGAFAGFGQGRNFSEGLGRAAMGAYQGAPADEAIALQEAAEAKRQEQLMAAVAEMRKYSPEIASIVETGGMDPSAAWNTIMQNMSAGPAKPIEVNGQLIDPSTYEVLGDYRDPLKPDANLPTGYVPDPNVPGGMMPAPGSPDDLKRAEAERARGIASQRADMTIQASQDAIDRALGLVSPMTAGNVMGNAANVPFVGQGAANLKAAIDTVKANLGFEQLQAMRESSPTGGALGQVAVQELTMLQATVASLDQTQSPEQLAASLAYIKQRLEALQALRQQPQQQAPGLDPDIEQLVQMYGGQ